MRIGFLFNHDQIHQLAHSLPIAWALASSPIDAEIVIATTRQNLADEITRLTETEVLPKLSMTRLGLRTRSSRLLAAAFNRILPAARYFTYRDNLDFFRSLDALIVTERTSLVLKKRYQLQKPILILSDHGAGDRAIGFGPSLVNFDHILAAGPKISNRMIEQAGVDPERISITGYPKFDMKGATKPEGLFADESKPVVLYNPHLSPHLSSWYKEGRKVLDFFLENDDYNLIFAPHIMLFQRRVVFTIDQLSVGFPGSLDPKYAAAPNIHVDVSSRALTDMSYTGMADIYLGDASSQVYEFLRTPKPCIFLNCQNHDFADQPSFAHWQFGPVISRADELEVALEKARQEHPKHYRPIQQAMFTETFGTASSPASHRAALQIADLLGQSLGIGSGAQPS